MDKEGAKKEETQGKTEGRAPRTGGPEESNHINVSVKKNPNFYVFLGKKYL